MAGQHSTQEIRFLDGEHSPCDRRLVSEHRVPKSFRQRPTKTTANFCLPYSYSWANEICAGDNEERAIVISSMNGFQYAVAAWLPIVIFPQTMAPDFRKKKQFFVTSFPQIVSLILHPL